MNPGVPQLGFFGGVAEKNERVTKKEGASL
jgi:hypothetical protein